MALPLIPVQDPDIQFNFDRIAATVPPAAQAIGDSALTVELATLTNADPFTFALSSSFATSNTTRNFDAGFFGVDVVTAGSSKAHCALQSVARISVADGNAWAFNTLVVTKSGENMQTELGAWSAEHDVNHYGVDSDRIWAGAGAQNVKGVTVVSGGTKRPFTAVAVETGVGKAPWVHGLRFAGQDNAGTWESAVWNTGTDILSQVGDLDHVCFEAHYHNNTQPAFSISARGSFNWGDGTNAVDVGLERVGSKRLRTDGALGYWAVTPPASKPAAPVTLGDVIALLQSYGFSS